LRRNGDVELTLGCWGGVSRASFVRGVIEAVFQRGRMDRHEAVGLDRLVRSGHLFPEISSTSL